VQNAADSAVDHTSIIKAEKDRVPLFGGKRLFVCGLASALRVR
jgi:hypothetical protein